MATETYAKPYSKPHWYPRWTWKALVALAAVCALAVIVVEVVEPLSMGLPIGWGHYDNAALHFRVGTPPQWNVVADNALGRGALTDCAFAVVFSPPTEPAFHSTLDIAKSPRWMGVFAATPCGSGGSGTQDSLWRIAGQKLVVEPHQITSESKSVDGQLNYAGSISCQTYTYETMLHEPTAAQGQRDWSDFLTMEVSLHCE